MNKNNSSSSSGNYFSGPKSPNKNSKRSVRRKSRGFVSLEVSSRKHRRANSRIYAKTDAAHKQKGKMDYH